MKNKLILTALLATSALFTLAQSGDDASGRPPRGPGGPGHRPHPPLVAALDANKDGKIDAAEIANAPAALAKLDKNGDGELTMDELMPPRGEGPGPRGPRGPRPDGPQQ